MGLALWHFVRWPGEPDFTPLTRKRADAIFGGDERFSGYVGQFLHLADVLVRMEQRLPTEVIRTYFWKGRIDAQGKFDLHRNIAAALDAVTLSITTTTDPAERLRQDAERLIRRAFDEEETTWGPTEAELHALCTLICIRAHKALVGPAQLAALSIQLQHRAADPERSD